MLSVDVALRGERRYAGLLLFSSTLICRSEWKPLFPSLKGVPVLMSHGTMDPILPHATAVELRTHFAENGADVGWIEFPGGHEIPPPVLDAAQDFIGSSTK